MILEAMLSGTQMALVGSPMANRLWVTGQTRRLHEDQKNQGTSRRPVRRSRGPTLEPGLGLVTPRRTRWGQAQVRDYLGSLVFTVRL
ncbi:hypothetical protein ILYODFUR_004989 [Ilyodon furcidens]|uniref:Uncharacterized protein n=1 Tax=Ilyodon furcidens TaxID=33524 RepID=A0ABV0TW74_9TELE